MRSVSFQCGKAVDGAGLEILDGRGAGGKPARDGLARDLHRHAHVAENLAELLVAPEALADAAH